jgi:hypothetical protein
MISREPTDTSRDGFIPPRDQWAPLSYVLYAIPKVEGIARQPRDLDELLDAVVLLCKNNGQEGDQTIGGKN